MVEETQNASPGRSEDKEINNELKLLSEETIFLEIIGSVSGITAVLNENRQIVYANDEFLGMLGIDDLEPILGKRPGEAVSCIHSGELLSGCGTSKACSVCGAVSSVLESQKTGKKSTREAIITSNGKGKNISRELQITTSPVKIRNRNFYIFSVLDISGEKRRQNLERIFFHDILNSAGNLYNLLSILKEDNNSDSSKELIDISERASRELIDEIMLHRQIRSAENGDLVVRLERKTAIDILKASVEKISRNEIAKGKIIEVADKSGSAELKTDVILLQRILVNLLMNALEATELNGKVYSEILLSGNRVKFSVSNEVAMPEEIQMQIFKRSFTTKGRGRGLGTYSIKLLTENYLGGKVYFTSSEKNGTTFTVDFPVD